jgi:REP element-mobilizing transposase RayT
MFRRMSRPLRFQAAGLIYHVMARGNNKMAIFLDDLDHARFLEMLADVVAKFEIDCWVLCLMTNHHHLVLRTRQPNLSLAMRDLHGNYAQWWNKRHGHIGHVFQGRFKAQIVEASVYLVRLCRYVLLNPVRKGLCAHPEEWRWNSYKMLAGTASSPCVDVDSLLRRIDEEDIEAVRGRLLDYVDPDADPEIAAFIRSDRRVIGTPAFAEQFRPQARGASKEVPVRERRVGTPGLADILAETVLQGKGLPEAVRRAHQTAGYSFAEIARCAGLSEKSVAKMADGVAPVRRRPGTRGRRNADLTPELGATQT